MKSLLKYQLSIITSPFIIIYKILKDSKTFKLTMALYSLSLIIPMILIFLWISGSILGIGNFDFIRLLESIQSYYYDGGGESTLGAIAWRCHLFYFMICWVASILITFDD